MFLLFSLSSGFYYNAISCVYAPLRGFMSRRDDGSLLNFRLTAAALLFYMGASHFMPVNGS